MSNCIGSVDLASVGGPNPWPKCRVDVGVHLAESRSHIDYELTGIQLFFPTLF
jgi:hypothetical protein